MFKAHQFRGPKYKKLSQYDDSSDGEDVIFEGENVNASHARPQQQRLGGPGQGDFMFSSYDVDEDLRLPSESSYSKRTKIPLNLRCTFRRCLLAVLVFAVIAAVVAAVIFFFYLQSVPSAVTHTSPSPHPTPHVGPTPSESLLVTASEAQSARDRSDGLHTSTSSSIHDGSPTHTSSVPSDSPTSSSFHVTPGPSSSPAPSAIINYTLEFPQSLTEMTPEFYDLNGDGVLDILLSLGSMQSMAFDFWKCHGSEVEEAREACIKYFGFYPCGCDVIAMDGRTGYVLWKYYARMEVFSVTCPSDLTGDGAVDCMLCGRGGMWEAVDGRTGEYIWSMDYSAVNALQNFYFPLNVGDLDKDGTVDFVNINSGDPRYEPTNSKRPPGRLVVISGKTGEKLLEPLLVPDMRESYMSPVLFRDDSGNEFILIGTGGETVEGGLWGITLESLRRKVEGYLQTRTVDQYVNDPVNDPHCHKDAVAYIDGIVPLPDPDQYTIKENLSTTDTDTFYPACPQTLFHPVPNVHDLCVYRVIASPEKGVILPPVIVDMNDDQVDDLVISLYCGHTLVLDGTTGSVIWDRYIPGTESYSIPAPLFYNGDRIPDLLVRVNKGSWDKGYQFSYIAVVDGASGSLLWAFNSSRVGFMSGTTLRGEGYGNDALLFTTVGNLGTLPLDEVKTLERVTQGKMVTHEWSPEEKTGRERRRREAVGEGHISVTEELETRLGLVKRESDADEDAKLADDLLKMLGINDTDRVNATDQELTNPSTSGVPTEIDPSELESSSSSSLPSLSLHPSVGAPGSSPDATLDASSDSLPTPSSAEVHTSAVSACSAPVPPLPSSKVAMTVSQQSDSDAIQATVPPLASGSSEGDLQTTSSGSSEGGLRTASSGGSESGPQTTSSGGSESGPQTTSSGSSESGPQTTSSGGSESGPQTTSSGSSEGDLQTTSIGSSEGDPLTASSTVDSSSSPPAGRPSDTADTLTTSQGVVLPSSAVEFLLSSEVTSGLLVAVSPSSAPIQPIGDSPSSTPVHRIGDSPPSSTAVISSPSPDGAEAIQPTSQITPVNDTHSTTFDPSSTASLTSQHPHTTTEPTNDHSSPFDAFFHSHTGPLDYAWQHVRYLKEKGWLDFTKNWHEVYLHDPVSDAEQFMREDCDLRGDKSASVYFLTRAMIEKNHVHPLYQELARVSYPNLTAEDTEFDNHHGERPRRHSGHNPSTPHNSTMSDLEIRHNWGCLHMIHPGTIASTPSLADLDGDGRLELVYFVPYSAQMVPAFPEIPYKLNVGADMMFMRVVTLEDAFQERIAPKLDSKTTVKFSTFLPHSHQPWTKYMGFSGDSHYKDTNLSQ